MNSSSCKARESAPTPFVCGFVCWKCVCLSDACPRAASHLLYRWILRELCVLEHYTSGDILIKIKRNVYNVTDGQYPVSETEGEGGGDINALKMNQYFYVLCAPLSDGVALGLLSLLQVQLKKWLLWKRKLRMTCLRLKQSQVWGWHFWRVPVSSHRV